MRTPRAQASKERQERQERGGGVGSKKASWAKGPGAVLLQSTPTRGEHKGGLVGRWTGGPRARGQVAAKGGKGRQEGVPGSGSAASVSFGRDRQVSGSRRNPGRGREGGRE